MAIFFDIRTLSLFSGCISACLFISMIYIYKNRKTYPGFKQWTVGCFLNFLGFVLLSLRNILPDLITIVFANVLIVLSFVLLARGLIYFTEGKQNTWMDVSLPAVLLIFFFCFVYIYPDLNMRIIVLSLIMIVLSLRCVSITHKKIPLVLGEKNRFLTAAFLWVTILLFLRTVLTISYKGHGDDFMLSSTLQGISIIAGSIGIIFIAIGLIIVNAQRLEKDLIEAHKEVKTLSGLLPICSKCKKIRDDKGYWNNLEFYLEEHSDASFSHGLCMECSDALYGTQDWYKKFKEKQAQK